MYHFGDTATYMKTAIAANMFPAECHGVFARQRNCKKAGHRF